MDRAQKAYPTLKKVADAVSERYDGWRHRAPGLGARGHRAHTKEAEAIKNWLRVLTRV